MGYIFKKASLKMTSLTIVFDSGASYESDGTYGTSHLMEHLVCQTFKHLIPKLTNEGIDWNAYTSNTKVVFYWSGLDSRLTPKFKRELVTLVLGDMSRVTTESFENEKKTVIQEYMDCFNDPSSCKVLNIQRLLFGYYDPIGRRDDIKKFTYEDMLRTKEEQFTRPFQIIEIGPRKTDFTDIEYESRLSKINNFKYSEKRKAHIEENNETDKCLVMAICKKMVSKNDYPYLKIACSMLTRGLESPFYEEIRVKRGLSYYSAGNVQSFGNKGMAMFSSCTDVKSANELKDLYESLLSNVENILTEERFNNIMSEMKINREKANVLKYDSLPSKIISDASPLHMPENLNRITFDKVVKVAKKYFNTKTMKIIK